MCSAQSGDEVSDFSVFLVDPHRLLREGIKVLLHGSRFQIVGESADPREALKQIEAGTHADLILAEWPKRKDELESFLQGVGRSAPLSKIVFLTDELNPEMLSIVPDHVCGLLQKDISTTALLYSLNLVMLNEHVFPIDLKFLPNAKRSGVQDNAGPAPNGDFGELSARELEILRCLMNGLANKLIARQLDVAETTVKAHIKTILRKINVDNRTQAAIWCLTRGLDQLETAPRPHGVPSADPWRVYSEPDQGARYERKAPT
jgi:two-component system, NarL family, nitrate/nitrite response regulator NarL